MGHTGHKTLQKRLLGRYQLMVTFTIFVDASSYAKKTDCKSAAILFEVVYIQ